MPRRARKNPRSSVPSDEAAADYPSDVAEGAIGVQLEGEEENRTGTPIVENSKGNATVVGWKTITHCHATPSEDQTVPTLP